MLISKSKKLIFIHNQKTAGMSITKLLRENISDVEPMLERHSYAEDAIAKLGRNAWDEYYSFGFVRNPWERLVSWYSMIQDTEPAYQGNKLWEYVDKNSTNFKSFIMNCTDEIVDDRSGYLYRKSFTRNQFDYFTDKKGGLAVSFIGKFESLTKSLDTALASYNIDIAKLGNENATEKKDYRRYYNRETMQIVAERFKKDIEYFRYEF